MNICQFDFRADYARRAFQRMLELNLSPDVFTMTALIDVVGRQEDLTQALELFHWMETQPSILPNIVTFVTLTRLAGICRDRELGLKTVFMLLESASKLQLHSQHSDLHLIAASIVTDVSLYNGALAALVRLSEDYAPAVDVLRMMAQLSIPLNELTIQILAKLVIRISGESIATSHQLSSPLADLISPTIAAQIIEAIELRMASASSGVQRPKPVYGGVLGSDASASLRQAVLQHDVTKLLDRIDPALGGDSRFLSENDFATLVHQARKRKWSDQIRFIVESLQVLCKEGWLSRGIPPQPQLGPTSIMYSACLSAYFSVGLMEEAIEVYKSLKAESNATLANEDFIYSTIKGFVQCGGIEWAVDYYFIAKKLGDETRQRRLTLGLLRGLGKHLEFGLKVLRKVANDSIALDGSEHLLECFITFLTSIAVIGSSDHFEQLLSNLHEANVYNSSGDSLYQMLSKLLIKEDPRVWYVCLLAVVKTGDRRLSHSKLRRWCSLNRFLPPRLYIPLATIVDEAFLSCLNSSSIANEASSRTTLPFRSFALVGCQRVIDSRLPLLRQLTQFQLPDSSDSLTIDLPLLFSEHHHQVNSSEISDYILEWLIQNRDVASAYTLILYRIHSLLLAVKNKAIRDSLEALLGHSLNTLSNDQKIDFFYGTIKCASDSQSLCATLNIPIKTLSKAFRIWISKLLPLQEIDRIKVIEILPGSSVSLEILKEVTKALSLDKLHEGKTCIAGWCYNMLLTRNEKLSRIIQFAMLTSTAHLLSDDNTYKAIAEYVAIDVTEFYVCGLFIKSLAENLHPSTALAMAKQLLLAGQLDLCCKLLIQFNVDTASEPSLHQLIHSTSEILLSNQCPLDDEGGNYLELGGDVEIVWIDSGDSLESLIDDILASDAVGVDVEWRPYLPSRPPTKCALMQLAFDKRVCLLDLLSLEKDHDEYLYVTYTQFIQAFTKSSVVKVGFGFRNDWRRLQESYPDTFTGKFEHLVNAVDLMHRGYNSLSNLAKEVLGLPLRKTMQVRCLYINLFI